MGCDIHMYVEYKKKDASDNHWRSFGGRINPGRNYDLFSMLAGVRVVVDPLYPVRGLPAGRLGWAAEYDAHLNVRENYDDDNSDHTVSRKVAEGWVAHNVSKWVGEGKYMVTHPDWHTHSWLTFAEFKKVVQTHKLKTKYCALAYHALVAAMQVLTNIDKNDVRVVFWFDN